MHGSNREEGEKNANNFLELNLEGKKKDRLLSMKEFSCETHK